MKRNRIHRITLAWLLSVVFAIPYVAKTIHIYESEGLGETCSHSENHHHAPGHDCNTCFLCHFTFSTFIETEKLSLDTSPTIYYHPDYILYQEKGYAMATSSHHLRAPPVARCHSRV
ncbi:hypothetical protein [Bacteroides sp. 51]|uniref:hypothetical protein n=1 Tax=Bacteroides sp. 51 TaxID=2302938 RepID=UPI0013D1C835|nr:hypothetical protein [Bacteroides sp. 51]